jgi:hypothetical protein
MSKSAPKHKLLEGHTLKFAFESGGINYFEFSDSNSAPCHRMFAAMDYYNEFKMRCTREYLVAHCQAVEEQMNGKNGTVDFMKVAQLHLQLKERLEWIFDPDTAYKYASVIFIDENEDPYTYDFKYGKEKIERWKKETREGFFLRMPVARLFPGLELSTEDLADYLKTLKAVKKEHLETIFTSLSKDHTIKDWYKTLESLRQEALV